VAAGKYRIVLRGRLSENFESAFDGMTLEHGPNRTVLTCDVRDQAQLYGLIDRLQEFGIELLAVEPADNSGGGPEPGCYPARAGGPWLCRTLVLVLFHAVVVPSGLTTRVQPQRWMTTWWWKLHSSTQSVTDVGPPSAWCRVWCTWQAAAR
jgi:hypothetical protein